MTSDSHRIPVETETTETETPRPAADMPAKPHNCSRRCGQSVLLVFGAGFAIVAIVLAALTIQANGLQSGTVSSRSVTADVYQFVEKGNDMVQTCASFDGDLSTATSCDGVFDKATLNCRCPPPIIKSETVRIVLIISSCCAIGCGVGVFLCCGTECRTSLSAVQRFDGDLSSNVRIDDRPSVSSVVIVPAATVVVLPNSVS